jgi:hypothetical protein
MSLWFIVPGFYNASAYVSKELRRYLEANEIHHIRIMRP